MDRDERSDWVPVLIAARKAWNWTQQDMAREAGVSLKSVGNMETGGMVPQESTVEKVRSALRLPDSLRAAEFEVSARERQMYEKANDIANARMAEQRQVTSLAEYSSAQLLRELLTRAEDPAYAETLERAAETEHYVELSRALEEVRGPLSEDELSEGSFSVPTAVAAHEDVDIAGEQVDRNDP